MYDTSKENDKDFLREGMRHLQEKIIILQKEITQLKKQKIEDEELCKKLAEELLIIKKRIFDSKQEKKANRARNQKKRRKGKIPHNQSENEKWSKMNSILTRRLWTTNWKMKISVPIAEKKIASIP